MVATQNLPPLIALYSRRPQSGKTTVAEYLVQYLGASRMSFAGPIRHAVEPLLAYHVPSSHTRDALLNGHLKDYMIPGIHMTGRDFIIGVGEGMRSRNPDFWCVTLLPSIMAARKAGWSVVVDDLRRENEYDMLAGLGAAFWKIVRPSTTGRDDGANEGLLCDRGWDCEVVNDGSLSDLRCRIYDAAKAII